MVEVFNILNRQTHILDQSSELDLSNKILNHLIFNTFILTGTQIVYNTKIDSRL